MMKQIKFSLLAVALVCATFSAEAAGKKATKLPAKGEAPQAAEEVQVIEEAPLATKLIVDNSTDTTALPGEQASAAAASDMPATDTAAIAAAPVEVQPTKSELVKLPENEIPVLRNEKEAKKAESNGLGRIFTTLAVLTVVLGAAVFGLKRWAAKKGVNQKNTQIKVLTQHALGPKKSLAIIQVAGESILIGVTDHNISMLRTLSLLDDEIPENVPNNFDGVLNAGNSDEEEGFTMQGLGEIRDRVSRRNSGKQLF